MKWCVQFPEEEILIKRPSLKRACAGNKHAATLLSYLLYQVSISQEFKQRTEQQISHTQEALDHSNEPAGSHGISIRGKAGLHGFSPCSTFNIQHFSFFNNPVNV